MSGVERGFAGCGLRFCCGHFVRVVGVWMGAFVAQVLDSGSIGLSHGGEAYWFGDVEWRDALRVSWSRRVCNRRRV